MAILTFRGFCSWSTSFRPDCPSRNLAWAIPEWFRVRKDFACRCTRSFPHYNGCTDYGCVDETTRIPPRMIQDVPAKGKVPPAGIFCAYPPVAMPGQVWYILQGIQMKAGLLYAQDLFISQGFGTQCCHRRTLYRFDRISYDVFRTCSISGIRSAYTAPCVFSGSYTRLVYRLLGVQSNNGRCTFGYCFW